MNTQEWSQLYARLAGDILGSAQPANAHALEQLLRARAHPSVHEARAQLHQRLTHAPRSTQHRFATAVNTDTLHALHNEVATVVNAYQSGELHVEQYIEALLLLAMFQKGFFDELTAVLLALESRERLGRRLAMIGGDGAPTEETVWREYQALQRELWQQRRQEAPVLIREIEPLAVETNNGAFLLPARVHVYDSLSGDYALDIDEPRRALRQEVTRATTVPWHHAQTGVLAHISFPDDAGWHHTPVHIMIWPHQLAQLRQRGTAVPARIGPRHDIVVHPQFFPVETSMGDEAIASLRVTPGGLEIRKTHPDVRYSIYT